MTFMVILDKFHSSLRIACSMPIWETYNTEFQRKVLLLVLKKLSLTKVWGCVLITQELNLLHNNY